ncbi:hypothetical protein COCNU_02G016840 [Cocos nucifera]|uniref:Uncharacterized protein n=1 Tax=Cocos nucifera TaxID=13894 RepID=A0A8K0MXI3_COCNU|nr:hypothetical protein COCNU_02G016840 [Cocos nucifera]
MPLAGRLSFRRSIAVISALVDLRHAAATNGGAGGVFELREERGYTSIRDLILTMPPAAAIHSAATAHVSGGWWHCEIPIRNRLVKQAARAYLQPMAVTVRASGSSSRGEAFRRFWAVISCGLTLRSCFDFVRRLIGAI